MQAITTVGLDIAKSVFQVHGVGADGHVVIRRQLKRLFVAHRCIRCAAIISVAIGGIADSRSPA